MVPYETGRRAGNNPNFRYRHPGACHIPKTYVRLPRLRSVLDVCTKRPCTEGVSFEWDEESKAGLTFRKHGVRMPEAIPAFDDPNAITIADDESEPNERRFVTLGMGAAGRFLVVVYTCRGENIRIISARPAAPHESKQYGAEL